MSWCWSKQGFRLLKTVKAQHERFPLVGRPGQASQLHTGEHLEAQDPSRHDGHPEMQRPVQKSGGPLGSVCRERGLGHACPSKRSCPGTAVLASAAALASASAGNETCPKLGRAGPGPGRRGAQARQSFTQLGSTSRHGL